MTPLKLVYISGVAIAAIIIHLLLSPPIKTAGQAVLRPAPDSCIAPPSGPSAAQEVWISALEWCESRGKHEAINKMDRDGTPSYGAFQFKPSTFGFYQEKYDLPFPAGVNEPVQLKPTEFSFMHYATQRAIVERMTGDPGVDWHQEFPDCVNKLGTPPRY